MSTRRAAGARSPSRRAAILVTAMGVTAVVTGTAGASAPEKPRGPEIRQPAKVWPTFADAAPSLADAALDGATARTLSHEAARLKALAGKPEQMGPLLALAEVADRIAPGSLDGTFRAIVDDPQADPLVSAWARQRLLRRLESSMGPRTAEYAALRGPLGLLSELWVVGPFGDGRASYGVSYPPETETGLPELARTYPGKERVVSWRRADAGMTNDRLRLDALLRPDSDATAYVLAFVRTAKATDAALRLGAPGPLKVWCNGALVHAADRVRAARFDQDAVGVHLRAGWNRILVKTVVTQGAWELRARLTAPDGRPLVFEQDGAKGPTAAELFQIPHAPHVIVRDLEQSLRGATRRATGSAAQAEAWLDLGRYLLAVDPADRDARAAAQAFEASARLQPTVPALLGLAAVAREDDERRRALERALAVAAPEDKARVLVALGDVARDQHHEPTAVGFWSSALKDDPRYWPATLAMAGEEQVAGLPSAALTRLDALPAPVRALPVVRRARARVLVALDRGAEAAIELRRAWVDATNDAELMREQAALAWEQGDAHEASQNLALAAAARLDLPSLVVDDARQLEGDGEVALARRILQQAVARMPHEFSLAAALGKLFDRQGASAEALPWLRTALALRPQDVELRRYVDATEARARTVAQPADDRPGAREDLAKAFAASVPEVLAAESHRPPARGTAPGEVDPAVVLLDRRVVRVHKNGLAETFAQRITAIRTDAGARDNKEFYVRYTPGSEEVEIREARIYRPDGHGGWEVLQSTGRDDQDLSEPWYGLYYDFRAEVVAFEGLRAGDVVDVEYIVADVSRENQLAGYFGDLEFVGESVPKRRWDYTLLGPPDRPFYFARPVMERLTESTSEENGEKVFRFAATDVPRVESEPAMPGLGETSPYLHVSTYRSWEEVGAWYWGLIEEQLVPDDNLRRAAAEALHPHGRGALSEMEKVRALHALVVGGTRYVGLEFGIHGFKPYKVSQVLSRRFGDCKDKAALLVVLLREAGIDAEMVLLRTRHGGRLATMPASLAIFDHAIVFIPKLNLYLDGTAEFSGMDELPGQDQGVMVLRVGPHGSHLDQTPVLPAARNRAVRRWDVSVAADGSADVREKLTLTGQAAPEWREHYQTKGERSDRYGKALSARNPGAQLLSVDMPGIEDRNRPVTVLSHATIPGLAEQTPDKALRLTLGTREVDLARTYARLSERRSPLVLGYPWQHDEQIVYQFPPRFAVTHLPASRRIVSPFGHFELQIRQDGAARVQVTGDLDVERDRVTAAEYPAFRRFLAEVDAAMAERITAAPRTVAPARTAASAP